MLASSVFPAVQSLLLAAAALGYGSALTTLAVQDPAGLAAAVALPPGVRPLAVVPVGRPAVPLGRRGVARSARSPTSTPGARRSALPSVLTPRGPAARPPPARPPS